MRDQNEHLDGQTDSLKGFDYRIVVTSTPGFHDAAMLDTHLRKYLKDLGIDADEDQSKVVFLVGDTNVPVMNLTLEWGKKHGYACRKFTARWDDIEHENAVVRTNRQGKEYNAMAAYWLNEELAELANYLITFYDGVSPDKQDLVMRMTERQNPCRAVLVHIDKDEEGSNYGRQSQGR